MSTTAEQQQEQAAVETDTQADTPMDTSYYDADFEFNAPRFCDFENPDGPNNSACSAWFTTDEAAQLEKLNPLGLDLSAISPISTPMSNISIRTPSTDGSHASKKLVFSESKNSIHQLPQHSAIKPFVIAKSNAPLTVPKSPNLLTTKRCQQQQQQHRRKSIVKCKLEEAKKYGHTNIGKYHYSLHTKPVVAAANMARHSLPRAFVLRTEQRGTTMQQQQSKPAPKSTYEILEQLRKEVPSRWKSKPDPIPQAPAKPLEPTQPKEFWLRSHARTRPRTVKSRKSIEREIMEKSRFKAKPVKPSVIQHAGQIGVPRVEKLQPTQVKEFALSKPKKRTREEAAMHEEERPAKKAKLAHNASVMSKFMAHHHSAKPVTEPHEFTLRTEIRGQAYQEKFRHQVEEERAKEAEMRSQFKALNHTAIYNETHVQQHEKPHNITIPDPFSLLSMARHEAAVAKINENRTREERERKERANFKAQQMPAFTRPFVPKRSEVPLTEVKEFHLTLHDRSVSRSVFNQKDAERRAKEDQEKKHIVEEQEQGNEENKTFQFKARPLPSFYASQDKSIHVTNSNNTTAAAKAIHYR